MSSLPKPMRTKTEGQDEYAPEIKIGASELCFRFCRRILRYAAARESFHLPNFIEAQIICKWGVGNNSNHLGQHIETECKIILQTSRSVFPPPNLRHLSFFLENPFPRLKKIYSTLGRKRFSSLDRKFSPPCRATNFLSREEKISFPPSVWKFLFCSSSWRRNIFFRVVFGNFCIDSVR